MSRVQLAITLALLASSLLLVSKTYESRRLFGDLDRLKTEQSRLEEDFKRLEAERQTQATHGRVEKTARDKLAMRNATPAVTEYVVDAAAPSQP